jgi:hypothetical protein
MNKISLALFFVFALSSECFSQTDSLDIFRVPSKSNNSSTGGNKSFNNAISLSVAHLGRGGTMLTYERFINNSYFSVFAGVGVTKVDYIGQYDIENEKFYYASEYTTRTRVDLNRMIELGTKFYFDGELGDSYLGLCYASYKNRLNVEVDDYYKVDAFDALTYNLKYSSNEFKFLYGASNDISSRFYSDFHIGVGFRYIDYQELDIVEVPVINNNSYIEEYVLDIEKDSNNDIRPWLFFGWKLGVRF